MKLPHGWWLFILSISITGCAYMNYSRQIPDPSKDRCFVIGQLTNTVEAGFPMGLEDMVGLSIDMHHPRGGIYNGMLMFSKEPGERTLSGVYKTTAGGTYYGAGVPVTTHSTTSLKLNRPFSCGEGDIVFLGLAYYGPSGPILFENSDESIAYLRKWFPQTLVGMESARLVRAPGKYLPYEKLQDLRKQLAAQRAFHLKRQGRFYVAANAGTLAEIEVSGSQVRVLQLLPPATYQDIAFNEYDETGSLQFSGIGTPKYRVVKGTVEQLDNR